jgi:hypothetical protein
LKKIAILLFAVVLAGGTVIAQENSNEGTGFSLGVELIVPDLEYAEDSMIIRPFVEFGKSFDAFDIYAGLGVPITLAEDETLAGIDFNLEGTYNLAIGDASSIAFTIGTWVYLPFDNDKGMQTDYMYFGTGPGSAATEWGWSELGMHFNLGVEYIYSLDFGDLYLGIAMPFNLISPEDPFKTAELHLTAGMDLEAGLGFGLTFYGWIGDSDAGDFAQDIDIFLTYEKGPLFFALTIGLPIYEDGFELEGLRITPEIEFGFDFGLSLYAGLPVSGIGANEDNSDGPVIGLTFGVKFNF